MTARILVVPCAILLLPLGCSCSDESAGIVNVKELNSLPQFPASLVSSRGIARLSHDRSTIVVADGKELHFFSADKDLNQIKKVSVECEDKKSDFAMHSIQTSASRILVRDFYQANRLVQISTADPTKQSLLRLDAEAGTVLLSGDGSMLALHRAAIGDLEVRNLMTNTSKHIQCAKATAPSRFDGTFSRDGSHLAVYDMTANMLMVWNCANWDLISKAEVKDFYVACLLIDSNNKFLILGGGNELHVYELPGLKLNHRITTESYISCGCFAGNYVAVGMSKGVMNPSRFPGCVNFYEIETGQKRTSLRADPNMVDWIDANESYFFARTESGIKVWDLKSIIP